MNAEPSKETTVEQLLRAQERHRCHQAALPIEQKIAILVRLQNINAQLARQKGRPVREPWNIGTVPAADRSE